MSELTLRLLQWGFLALLWALVLSVAAVMRRDLFTRRRAPAVAARTPAAAAAPALSKRAARKQPRRLVVTQGPHTGLEVPLDGSPVTLGRAADNTLVLTDDDYVSSHHARLLPAGAQQPGAWLAEDLGSTNGTYLDKTRLTAATPVPPGAHLRLGKTVVELLA